MKKTLTEKAGKKPSGNPLLPALHDLAAALLRIGADPMDEPVVARVLVLHKTRPTVAISSAELTVRVWQIDDYDEAVEVAKWANKVLEERRGKNLPFPAAIEKDIQAARAERKADGKRLLGAPGIARGELA
jgi:hypothetical protein